MFHAWVDDFVICGPISPTQTASMRIVRGEVDMVRWRSPNITPSDWLVMGYGVLSGVGVGLWDSDSLAQSLSYVFVGFFITVATVVVSKAPVGFGCFRLPYYFENMFRVLMVGVPAAYLAAELFNKRWFNGMVLAWIVLPLLYLCWRQWRARTEDNRLHPG